jgi:hypothetical protein
MAVNVAKFIYSAKGFAQASKTVGNNITHERNLQSSGIIMLSNGLNPFSKETFKSVQVAWSAIKPTDNKAINNLYNEYLRLGITNQNAKLGDIRRLISESQKDVSGTFLDKLASKTGLKYLGRQVEKAYVAEDDIWKIAVYENELKILKKAYKHSTKESLEKLKQEAARITRNTMPTYDMIPSGFKFLRYGPWGNYYAFHAERFRNTFHSYKQAVDEIKSGNEVLKQRGYKRLAGQVTVGQTGSLMVASSSMYHTGVSKEEDSHIKNIFKQSYNGNNWLYDVQDKSGELLFADTKYTDPSAPVNDAILTPIFDYLNTDKMTSPEFEERFFKALSTSFDNFTAPFVDTTILYGAVMDIFERNGRVKGPDGEQYVIEGWDSTTNNFETKVNNFIVGTSHIVKNGFMPVFVDNITNTIEIRKEQPDKYGVTKDKDLNRFKNLAGLNYKPINNDTVLKRVSQISKGFNFDTRDVRNKTLNKYVGENNVTIAKLKHQYLLANRKHYLNFTNLKRTVNSVVSLQEINPERYNYTRDDIKRTLKDSNLSREYYEQLMMSTKRDNFIPLTLSSESIDKIIEMNPSINRSILEQELQDLKYELMDLPLLDIRDEYSETQKQSLDTLYERKQYVEGGKVSKEYPVSDALETPADRVNPTTGLPFSDQMARLGLREGGNVGNPITGQEIVDDNIVRTYQDGTTSSVSRGVDEPGLKPVAPAIELLAGGLYKTGQVARNIIDELTEKVMMPKTVIHGSSVKGLKEIKSSNARVSKPNEGLQSSIYTTKRGGLSSDYGFKGQEYPLDTSSLSSLKNIASVGKNKVINSRRPPKKLLKELDIAINNAPPKEAKNLKMFKNSLGKKSYVSDTGPAVRNFLDKNNVKVIKTKNKLDSEPTYILVEDMVKVKGK